MQSEIKIVPMRRDHIAQVAELERTCFPDPWPEEVLHHELENPLSLWLVALQGQAVAGYIGSQSVLDDADMMNLAVRPQLRRLGIGSRLTIALAKTLQEKGVKNLCLEVRVSNAPAIGLYQSLGFVQVGRRPRYYFHPKEDALILKKRLGGTE